MLRTIASCALLANCGLAAPAAAAAVPQFTHYVLRNFSGDAPAEGVSAFGLEMRDMRCGAWGGEWGRGGRVGGGVGGGRSRARARLASTRAAQGATPWVRWGVGGSGVCWGLCGRVGGWGACGLCVTALHAARALIAPLRAARRRAVLSEVAAPAAPGAPRPACLVLVDELGECVWGEGGGEGGGGG